MREISPVGASLQLFGLPEAVYGHSRIYDVGVWHDSSDWNTPLGWIDSQGDLSWPSQNGKLLILAIPNAIPCMSPSNPT